MIVDRITKNTKQIKEAQLLNYHTSKLQVCLPKKQRSLPYHIAELRAVKVEVAILGSRP